MNRNDSRPVLKTSGVGDSLAEFNYLAALRGIALVFAVGQPRARSPRLFEFG
jgi:hypothetical protein